MSALTLEQLTTLRDAYFNAELALLAGGQEYAVGNMRFVRAKLPEIIAERRRLDGEIAALDPSSTGDKSSTNLATFGVG